MKERKSKGFYVMSRTTSVAWCSTYEAAKKLADFLNQRGGAIYTIKEA